MPDTPEDLVDLIYESAFVPDHWHDVLGRLAALTGTTGGVLLAQNGHALKMIGSTPEFLGTATECLDTFADSNERLLRLLATGRSGFIQDRDVFTDEELRSNPMHRDFLIPRGLGFGMATAIQLPSGDDVVIHVEGRYQPVPFGPPVIRALDSLRPHLARASLVSARIAFEAARSAVETLDRIAIPAVALGALGEVLIANPSFQTEGAVWTTRLRDRIALHDAAADRLLAEALAGAYGANAVRSIPITREGGPAILHVVPVRRSARDLFSRCVAIAVLTRATREAAPSDTMLRALFDLTAAEVDVARRLASGQSTPEIAQARRGSAETVRNQIKRVLVKTGTSRQADLVGLLRSLANPVSTPPMLDLPAASTPHFRRPRAH